MKCSKTFCVSQVEVDANVHVEEFQRQQGRMEKKQQELEQRGEELEKTIPCTGGENAV